MLYIQKPQNFSPKFEVVSCFVQNDGDFLLLHRQDSKPSGNSWGMPAGKVEKGENIYDSVLREVKEETGISLKKSELEYFKKLYVKYPDFDFIYHIFNIEYTKRPKIILNSIEHKAYKWVVPKEALKMELIEDLDRCINLFYSV